MRAVRDLERLKVYGQQKKNGGRKYVGKVNHVLFHPSELKVVGFAVDRPDILFLFRRRNLMLAADRTRLLDDRVLVNGDKAWGKAAAKRLGIDWDKSVIWVGMPVRSESGMALGSVRDAMYDPADGSLNGLGLTGGMTADLAVGVIDLPARMVIGFRDDAIVVTDEALQLETDGGAAAAAGRTTAVAIDGAAKAAAATAKGAATAAAYGKSAVKLAGKTDTVKTAGAFWKSVGKQIMDAAGSPDDDKK